MRVLVTGGTGGLGPSICKAFLEEGCNARILLHRKMAKRVGANCELVWGDVTQPDSVKKATEGVDAIVHLAGIVPPFSEENPELTYKVNVGGTRIIVDAIKESGKHMRFIFLSSVAVFGPRPAAAEALCLDSTQLNATSIYAKSKIQAETLIRESGIDYIILRATSIPYQNLIRLSKVKTYLKTISAIPLKNRIEFCHPDDAALAILNAVKNFELVKGNTLIIAGGPSQQILFEDMLRAILRTYGLPLPPRHKFAKEPYALDWYDTTRSQELLNYQRKTLDDYCKDLDKQFPTPFIFIMRHCIGPVFGRVIVRLM